MSNDIQRVRDAVDLVALISEYIPLESRGREWVGICPFHEDHKPSMCVVTHHENAFYKCFSCGAFGSCFDFVQNYLKMDFRESLIFLADRVGVELTNQGPDESNTKQLRAKMKEAMDWAAKAYREALSSTSEGNLATDLLKARGFTIESIEKFGIGVAPDDWGFLADRVRENADRVDTCLQSGLLKKKESSNRIYDAFRNRLMFPICSEFGDTIAFGGRRLQEEDEPKYINSPETELFHKSSTLYGYQHALNSIRQLKKAIVVEGYTDVIACHQTGITNVVATLGTAFTKEHAKILSRICDTAVLVFDGDVAGQSAADRAIEIFFNSSIDVMICVLPQGKDPADLAFEQDAFEPLLENAVDALSFKLDRLQSSLQDQSSTAGRERQLQSFMEELERLGFEHLSGIRKRFVYERIGTLLSMSMQDVEALMKIQSRPVRPALHRHYEGNDVELATQAISKKRQKAEYELLGVMLYDPTESSAFVRESSRVIEAGQFANVLAAELASIVLPKLQSGITYTMQELLSDLSVDCKPVATTLYFEGQRLSETHGSVMLAIQSSMDAFFNTLDHNAMKEEIKNLKSVSDPEVRAKAAQQTLEAIRKKKVASNL